MKQPIQMPPIDKVRLECRAGIKAVGLDFPLAEITKVFVAGKCVHNREATYLEISGYVIVVPDGSGGIARLESPGGVPYVYPLRKQARHDLQYVRKECPTAIIRKLSGFVSLSKA